MTTQSPKPPSGSDDLQVVLEHLASGEPLDPDFEAPAFVSGQEIRREIRARHGVIEAAVELIREARTTYQIRRLTPSVALKWVLPEPDSDKADLLREDYRNGIHQLIAPDIFPVEIAHALTRAEPQPHRGRPSGTVAGRRA